MRTKKTYIVLSFRTTVEAMAWEKHCATAQIPGRLIRSHGRSPPGAALPGA